MRSQNSLYSCRMRFFWISFLFIRSITCAPQKPGSEGDQSRWWYVASPSQPEPSKPIYQDPSGQVSGSAGYLSYPGLQYYSGGTSGAGGADSSSTHGAQQSGQQGVPGPYQFAEESWSSSSDPSGEDEPVFNPVDEEDQVYGYKSKSRYNRKQLRFGQFRYTPTEPIVVQPPMFPPAKNPPGQKGY